MKNSRRICFLIMIIWCASSLLSICFASGTSPAADDIRNSGQKILRAFAWFGYAVSLGMLIFIGIKYMIGSVDAKANMKTTLVSWVVGAFLVFMASTITLWVVNIAGLNDDTSIAQEIINAGKSIK